MTDHRANRDENIAAPIGIPTHSLATSIRWSIDAAEISASARMRVVTLGQNRTEPTARCHEERPR